MPASTPRPVPRTSVTLHGLGCAVDLQLLGDRTEALADALDDAWSRCRTPQQAERPAKPITVRLRDPQTVDGVADPAAADIKPADPAVPATSGSPAAPARPDDPAGHGVPDPDPVDGTRLDAVLQHVTQAVTRSFIAAQAGRLLMLHAGACAHPETGAAVVYVAPGGTGKTTLSRVLGQSLGYLTDETVGITRTGRIRPYQKPLSIRTGGFAAPKAETSPDALGLVAAPADPWLRRIVLLDRSDDHTGAPLCEELDIADAIIALAPETSSLSSLDRPLHLVADLLATTGPVLRWRYREATDLAPILTGLLEAA